LGHDTSTEQFDSEASLFETADMDPSAPAFSFSPSQKGVPAAQQAQSSEAQITSPDLSQNHFTRTFRGMTSESLSKIFAKYASQFDSKTYIDGIKYQGFNREEFISTTLSVISPLQLIRLALIGSIRGANFEKILKSSSSIDADIVSLIKNNVVVRRAKEASDITILRCVAAIPEWVAYFMGTAGVTKKLQVSCPAALQFPAAAALPMSATVRTQHVQFSVHFSRAIGGVFNDNIYMAMVNNMLPLSQIPDSVRLILGVTNDSEAQQVDIKAILADAMQSR